eukprot:g16757.t1
MFLQIVVMFEASSSTPSQSFAVNDEEQEAPKKKRRRKTRGNGRPSTRLEQFTSQRFVAVKRTKFST